MVEQNQLATASGDTDVSPDLPSVDHDFTAAPSRRLEVAVAAVALVLSVAALILSRSIYLRMGEGGLDPKWWPTVLSSAAGLLSAILLGFALFGPPIDRNDTESAHRAGWTRMLTALALSALYVFAWSAIGYIVPTLVYLFALLWSFGLRSWKGLVIFPVATTAFIYGLFHTLLRVPL